MTTPHVIGDRKKGPQWYDSSLADKVAKEEQANAPAKEHGTIIYVGTFGKKANLWKIPVADTSRLEQMAVLEEDELTSIVWHEGSLYFTDADFVVKCPRGEYEAGPAWEVTGAKQLASSGHELYTLRKLGSSTLHDILQPLVHGNSSLLSGIDIEYIWDAGGELRYVERDLNDMHRVGVVNAQNPLFGFKGPKQPALWGSHKGILLVESGYHSICEVRDGKIQEGILARNMMSDLKALASYGDRLYHASNHKIISTYDDSFDYTLPRKCGRITAMCVVNHG